jgi:hypothetical protein
VGSCCPGPAKAKVAKDNVKKAIAYFFIKHCLSTPRYFVTVLVKATPAEKTNRSTAKSLQRRSGAAHLTEPP